MRHIVVLAVLLVATIPGLAQPATDYVPMTQDIDGHTWGIVVRKEVTLFGIPVPAGGFTVGERARIIADERLDVLYDGGVLDKPKNIRVGKINGEVTIYVKNPDRVGNLPSKCLILTIDRNFEQFLAAVREGRRPPLDGLEGRKAVAIVAACYKSARTGRAATVEDPRGLPPS